jgi:hypothetical protein
MSDFEQDDFELEISNLPDTGDARRVPALVRMLAAHPRLRARLWAAATGGLALILLLLSLNGNWFLLQKNLSSLYAHPTPVPTVQSAQVVIVQEVSSQFDTKKVIIWNASTPPVVADYETLGQVPQSCPQDTIAQNFASPAYPAGVGSSPMWVTGFAGPRAVLNHLVRADPPLWGWYQQLALVSETNYAGTVTLQGGIVGNTFPLWFGLAPHDGELITSISVNPMNTSASNHFGADQQWGVLPIHIFIAEAGCYYLQATWDGGSWTAYFAAGR